MNHLTDEQLLEWLEGEASRETSSHLEGCAECRNEAEVLRLSIARYSIAVRRQAALAQSAHLAKQIDPRRALLWHRLRWAGASALMLLLAAPTAWMLKPRPANTIAQPVIQPAVQPALPDTAHPLPAANSNNTSSNDKGMSDDELLEAVNNDLSQDVPQALAPVSTITDERNKIAVETDTTTAPITGNEGEAR